jgi:hypothetical protein
MSSIVFGNDQSESPDGDSTLRYRFAARHIRPSHNASPSVAITVSADPPS